MADIYRNGGINYINMYGSMKNAWRRHKEIMKKNRLPYVNYTTFTARVKERGWDLYKSVHTPANAKYRDNDRKRKALFSTICERISDFFRTLFNL